MREDIDIKKLRQRLRENKAKQEENKLNVRNIKLVLPEAPVTPLKQTASKKGKSKSETRKRKVAVQEGLGKPMGKSAKAKSQSKSQSKSQRKSKVKPMRKSDMIYNILSQRAGNDNKLMKKRIAKAR
jgi:hypothetical protein